VPAAARYLNVAARQAGGAHQTKENEMRIYTQLCAGTLSLALLGSAGVALGQTAPGAQEKLNLSPSQERMVTQGLQNEKSQPAAPGFQGQVGSKVPDSMNTRQLPSDVTAQVPQTKSYLFVKLPDRILLIDPETKLVAEIVTAPAGTTGSGASESPSR
jgi:hypothetical protein